MTSEAAQLLEIENVQLRTRIRELEHELSSTYRTTRAATVGDALRQELPGKIATEVESLGRASAFAFLEHLRSTADIFKSVADEAFRREQLHDSHLANLSRSSREGLPVRIAVERLAEIPNDVAAITATGVEGLLKTPRRVLEKFFHFYRDPAAGPAPVSSDPAGFGPVAQKSS